MTIDYCDLCKIQITKYSEKTPLTLDYYPTHAQGTVNSRRIAEHICPECMDKIFKFIESMKIEAGK